MNRERFFEQYGLSSWLYVNCDLENAMTKIAKAGFRQVELWGDQAHLDPRNNPDIRAIRGLVRDLGLRVHSVHLPYGGMDLGYLDCSLKDDWLQITGTALEYSAQLGCQIAVVHVSMVESLAEKSRYEDIVRVSSAFIHELKAIADRFEVRLALENLIRPKFVFGWSLVELANAFPDEGLGFCLDTGHAALGGLNIAAEAQAAGQRLLTVHASNNDGLHDRHQLPTQGVLDWSQVEEGLAVAKYRGCRVLELFGGDDPDAVLEQAKNLWRYI